MRKFVRSLWGRGRVLVALVALGMVMAMTGVPGASAVAAPVYDDELSISGPVQPFFGYWVSVSGDTAMIGAPFAAHGLGAVYVYTLVAGTWVQTAVLTPSDPAPGDAFGRSVVITGTTAVIGAAFKTSPSGALHSGAAYVFDLVGGVWTQTAKLLPPQPAANGNFGRGMAMNGSTIVVGAPGTKVFTGSAYVFVKTSGTWTYQATLKAPDGIRQDSFGKHLAVLGSTAIVGAPAGPNGGTGSAYVFHQSGTKWTLTQKLVGLDSQPADNFGRSVSMSGTSVLIGANHEPPAIGKGAAYVFTESGGVWTQQQKLVPLDSANKDMFGRTVALQGNTAVIGAPGRKYSKGGAYVFTFSGGVWTQSALVLADNSIVNDDIGRSVAIDGNLLVLGAPQKYVRVGAAYIFTGSGSTWTQMVELPSMRTS